MATPPKKRQMRRVDTEGQTQSYDMKPFDEQHRSAIDAEVQRLEQQDTNDDADYADEHAARVVDLTDPEPAPDDTPAPPQAKDAKSGTNNTLLIVGVVLLIVAIVVAVLIIARKKSVHVNAPVNV